MKRLDELQRLFHDLVVAPEGVARGLEALGRRPGDLDAVVRGDVRMSAVERLDVYANMYFYRILDALRADYERLAAALGEVEFHNLVTDYLVAHPPRHASLREVGDRLPAFLAASGFAPVQVELAALERAKLEVFDDVDAEPLTLDELRALPAERFAALPLRLVHALRLVPSATGRILVWRQALRVHHRRLEDHEPLELCDGRPFGALCDHLLSARAGGDVAQLAFSLLGRWVQDGLLQKPAAR
jgi:hypothetical protein